MYLAISDDGVVLHQPEHLTDFYASYRQRLTQERLAAVLAEQDAGTIEDQGAHVWVPVATLRRLATGRVPEGWDADFDAMIAQARSKGWLSDDGESVRAHLERER